MPADTPAVIGADNSIFSNVIAMMTPDARSRLDAMLTLSPTLQAMLREYVAASNSDGGQYNKITLEPGKLYFKPPVGGAKGKLVLDSHDVGNPEAVVSALAHELGHFMDVGRYVGLENAAASNSDTLAYMQACLSTEGQAIYTGFKVSQEIKASSGDFMGDGAIDIGVRNIAYDRAAIIILSAETYVKAQPSYLQESDPAVRDALVKAAAINALAFSNESNTPSGSAPGETYLSTCLQQAVQQVRDGTSRMLWPGATIEDPMTGGGGNDFTLRGATLRSPILSFERTDPGS